MQSLGRPPAWEVSWVVGARGGYLGACGLAARSWGLGRHQGLPEMKEISLKSSHGPAKRKRHCKKRATRPPRGTDTVRALGSPRLPPRT